MHEQQRQLEEFHRKHNFPIGITPGENQKTDLVRLHLIAEEGIAELALALAEQNIVKVADALGDLAYVTLGAAVTYGLPLEAIFDEVHKSNMTKAVRNPNDTRLRNKGDSYRSPNIEGILLRSGVGYHQCGNTLGGFTCTMGKNHKNNHAAHGDGGAIITSWSQQ